MSSSAIDSIEPFGTETPVLDRTVDLSALGWTALAWAGVVATAIGLHLLQLDLWALGADEARRAYDAWLLYRGQPPLPGQSIPDTAPLFLIGQALSFFLFGVTDVTARLLPALSGLAIVALTPLLTPLVGRAGVLGTAALLAFSPTLVYASRTASPEVVVAALSICLVIAVVRTGLAAGDAAAVRRWSVAAGITAGALVAAGPSALSGLLAVAVGLGLAAAAGESVVRRGFLAMRATRSSIPAALIAFVLTVVVCFTQLFANPAAIAGVGRTFGDWGRLLVTGASATPTQFFLLALFLYEPLAIVLGVVAALGGRTDREHAEPPVTSILFGGWFVIALLLWSFSAGRQPTHAIHVALPLLLLAGTILGQRLAAIDRRELFQGAGGGLALALTGVIIGLLAVGVLISNPRAGDPGLGAIAPMAPAVIVVTLVVVPLSYVVFALIGGLLEGGKRDQPGLIALLVVAVLLGAFTFRSAVLLNFFRADESTELLAERTATAAVKPAVGRIERLARDFSVTDASVRDLTGGHSTTIAVEREVRWPFQWYFRDFPNYEVVDAGQAPLSRADVVIAAADAGLAEAGFTVREYAWLNRVPPAYAAPNIGALLGDILSPAHWEANVRFLLFRDGLVPGDPEQVAIGFNRELANQLFPSSGPYSLADRRGPGAARGQFNDPLGIAVGERGAIYVVDQANARIQRFDANGAFIDLWGGPEGDLDLGRLNNTLGPTGITVGPDGLVYVADTWNHRVLVLLPTGEKLREIGAGERAANGAVAPADTTDDPSMVQTKPGLFFGPRAVAVTADEVYVVDTGNERVQVFGIDGAFKRAWGGFGSGPGQLIEPGGIAIGPDGNVYVADAGNRRISIHTPRGEPVAQWPAEFWPPLAPDQVRPAFQPYLAFDAAGNLYVTSSGTGVVMVLDREGRPVETITQVDGESLRQPLGIAIAPNGDILLTDLERDAVYRYVPPRFAQAPALIAPAIDRAPPGTPPAAATPVAAAPTTGTLPEPPGGRG